jgi:hypothetical protein
MAHPRAQDCSRCCIGQVSLHGIPTTCAVSDVSGLDCQRCIKFGPKLRSTKISAKSPCVKDGHRICLEHGEGSAFPRR